MPEARIGKKQGRGTSESECDFPRQPLRDIQSQGQQPLALAASEFSKSDQSPDDQRVTPVRSYY
jgi:hypothetical protein